MKVERRELLGRFREMPGEHRPRIFRLLSELKAEGIPMTYRKLLVELRDLRSEDIRKRHARILSLIGQGLSIREVGRRLNIPFTTVSSVKVRTARKTKKK